MKPTTYRENETQVCCEKLVGRERMEPIVPDFRQTSASEPPLQFPNSRRQCLCATVAIPDGSPSVVAPPAVSRTSQFPNLIS
ncbi:unnamed protein product [Cuscuta campestris]|uniref:Uncharacterized protein n=1 Tax=Cuscuta campestris TaxID=132261 RepID=A0A484LG20_9ASTE|nr:unnamed protein product [Cuscuta campestris]